MPSYVQPNWLVSGDWLGSSFPAEGVVLVRPHFGRGAGAVVVAGQVVKEPLLGHAAGGVVKRLGHDAFEAEFAELRPTPFSSYRLWFLVILLCQPALPSAT